MFFCLPFFLLQSSGIKVLEADMLDLPFSNGVFDVIIEKGTMVNVQFVMVFPFNFVRISICDTWNSHNYDSSTTLSLTLMSQLCITILNFEGCIVRG
jgi:hypothetical protein